MSSEANKRLVLRLITEVIKTGNLAVLSVFVADQIIDHNADLAHPPGIEGSKQHLLGIRSTFRLHGKCGRTTLIERQADARKQRCRHCSVPSDRSNSAIDGKTSCCFLIVFSITNLPLAYVLNLRSAICN